MKGKLRLLLLATVPLFVFVNVYQTYRYQTIERSVALLTSQQKSWLEENKRMIAGIAVLSAPQRIEQIAKNKLGLTRNDLQPTLQIRVPDSGRHGREG